MSHTARGLYVIEFFWDYTNKDLWRPTYIEDLRINAVLKEKGGHRKLTLF